MNRNGLIYNVSGDIIYGDISSLGIIDQKSPKFGTFQIILLRVILNLVKLHKYSFHNVIIIKLSTLRASFKDLDHTLHQKSIIKRFPKKEIYWNFTS